MSPTLRADSGATLVSNFGVALGNNSPGGGVGAGLGSQGSSQSAGPGYHVGYLGHNLVGLGGGLGGPGNSQRVLGCGLGGGGRGPYPSIPSPGVSRQRSEPISLAELAACVDDAYYGAL